MGLKRKMLAHEILSVNGVKIRFLGRAEILVLDQADLKILRTSRDEPTKVVSEKSLGAHKKPT